MTRHLTAAALALALLGTSAASATSLKSPNSLESCGDAGSIYNGLAATNLRVKAVSCPTARKVARRTHPAGRQGGTVLTRVNGITWRCTTIQSATGTDPGFIAATTIKCRRGGHSSAVVRYELRS